MSKKQHKQFLIKGNLLHEKVSITINTHIIVCSLIYVYVDTVCNYSNFFTS